MGLQPSDFTTGDIALSRNTGNGTWEFTKMPATPDTVFGINGSGVVTAIATSSLGGGATSFAGLTGKASTAQGGLNQDNSGTSTFTPAQGVFFDLVQTKTNYIEGILQNLSGAAAASTDLVLSNDVSTATTFYGNFGINSSGFTGSGSLNLASATYLTATSGELVLGTTTANGIRFVTNSGTTDALNITNANAVIFNQTWNAAGTTFNGYDIKITDTASAAASVAFRVLGGASASAVLFSVRRDGSFLFTNSDSSGSIGTFTTYYGSINFTTNGSTELICSSNLITSASKFGVSQASGTVVGYFFLDSAGVFGQRNSTNAQSFRVYGTYTDASNYVRLGLNTTSTTLTIAAESAGTGAANIDLVLTPKGTGNISLPGGTMFKTAAALTNGAAAAVGTLTNAPVAGNPTKWAPINDNGTTRYIPMW
jgi:hypothetical protein